MRRREFIGMLGGAVAWPLRLQAQERSLTDPVRPRFELRRSYEWFHPKIGDRTWSAFNSTWNVGKAVNGKDFVQVITGLAADFPKHVTMRWQYPNNDPPGGIPWAFPCLIYGNYGGGLTSSVVPPAVQINSLMTLNFRWAVSIFGLPDTYDVAWDGYFGKVPTGSPPDQSDLTHELMLFAHNPSYSIEFLNGQSNNFDFTDATGLVWTICRIDRPRVPPIIAMYPKAASDLLAHEADVKSMLLAAQSHGMLTGNEYFRGIGLGCEMRGFASSITVDDIGVTFA